MPLKFTKVGQAIGSCRLPLVLLTVTALGATQIHPPTFADSSGILATYRIDGGPVELTGPFFEKLGPNGRSCSSCHQPAQGWSISADEVRARFEKTKGRDPIFRKHDGANCDQGSQTSYSLLTGRGLIRIPMPVPVNPEFDVVNVQNPYGCNQREVLSTYRRPLPATNLRFLTSVMWDGRESSAQTGTHEIGPATNLSDLTADLAHQANDAVSLHAMAKKPLTSAQQQALVQYEMSTATAQISDHEAGALDGFGGQGGPIVLASRTMPEFFVGINDSENGNPHGIKPENSFRLFDDWSRVPYGRVYVSARTDGDQPTLRRDSISRGQVLFNQRPFDIRGVAGFNDDLHRPSVVGACGTCHNAVNAGSHSVAVAMNTGVSDMDNSLGVTYLPVITLRNKTTGETKATTDPGKALVTGLWKDIGKMKVPVLRALAARPPYFHNGSARTLADVVEFYDKRFGIGFSDRDKADLVAFLSSL